jgi:hypothetical protein
VLTCGVTTSLSMMSVVLSGWTPDPGSGSVRVAEMTGHEVVITEPWAGMVSLMRGGWSSNCRLKRVVHSDQLSMLSAAWARRWYVELAVRGVGLGDDYAEGSAERAEATEMS